MTTQPPVGNPFESPNSELESSSGGELEVTWPRVLRVWWAYFWRNLLCLVGVVIVSAIVGGVIGFVLGAAGVSSETIAVVTTPIGFAFGILASIVPLWLILGKNFGEFRLALVRIGAE